MERIKAEYQITVSDLRQASYYGLFMRRRRPLQIMFVVLAAGVLYAAGAGLGLGEVNPLVLFLAGAYLLWGLLLFAGTERDILRYIKSPDSLIGCTYAAVLESHRITLRIPEKKAEFTKPIGELACVFELSRMFLIYVDSQQVYLLPHRALTKEERASLREVFRKRLGDRFSSRFGRAGKAQSSA